MRSDSSHVSDPNLERATPFIDQDSIWSSNSKLAVLWDTFYFELFRDYCCDDKGINRQRAGELTAKLFVKRRGPSIQRD